MKQTLLILHLIGIALPQSLPHIPLTFQWNSTIPQIIFHEPKPLALAIFNHHPQNNEWLIILDTTQPITMVDLPAIPGIKKLNFHQTPSVTIGELVLESGLCPIPTRQNNLWTIQIQPITSLVQSSSKVQYNFTSDGNFTLTTPGKAFTIQWPEQSYVYCIILSEEVDGGIPFSHANQEYYRTFSSSQGIAFKLHTAYTLSQEDGKIIGSTKAIRKNSLKEERSIFVPQAPFEEVQEALKLGHGEEALSLLKGLLPLKNLTLEGLAYLCRGDPQKAHEAWNRLDPVGKEIKDLKVLTKLQKLIQIPQTLVNRIQAYPPALRDRLLPYLWQYSYVHKDWKLLEALLDSRHQPSLPNDQALFSLYLARLAQAKGKPQEAIALLDRLAYPAQEDRDKIPPGIQVEAAFELTVLQEPVIALQERINTLEKIRQLWRGDDLEPRITIKLVDYLCQANQQRRAVELLDGLIRLYPDQAYALGIPYRLHFLFLQVLSGKADFKDSLEEIAFFKKYQHGALDVALLLPSIERIVQDLAGLDLLDQAADFYANYWQPQKDSLLRTVGLLKAAQWHLEGHNPDPALAILQTIDSGSKETIELKAKALYQKNLYDQALQTLQTLEHATPTSFKLQIDIYLAQQNWQKALSTLEKNPLKDQDSILQLVALYHITRQLGGLANARQQYLEYMKSSKDFDLFDTLTREPMAHAKIIDDVEQHMQDLPVFKKILKR